MFALTASDSVFTPGFLSSVRDERFADDFESSGRGLQESGFGGGIGEGARGELASVRIKNLPRGETLWEVRGSCKNCAGDWLASTS